MSERFELEFGSRTKRTGLAGPQRAMRILIMGDFGGRGARGPAPAAVDLSELKTLEVDAESFERVMRRLAPSVELDPAVGSDAVALEFASLTDFHPDRLFRATPLFRRLRETRAGLQDPATFAAAAAELRGSGDEAAGPPAADDGAADAAPESDGDTLERLLGRPSSEPSPPSASAVGLSRFIRDAVGPHLTVEADPRAPQLVAALDRGASDLMRRLLHHPAVHELEAIWRGVHWLLQRLETGEQVRVHLLDVSRDELLADLRLAGGEPNATGLFKLLVGQGAGSPGGEPWSLLVGNYTFGPSAEDVGLLVTLGALASQAGGPFLAAASPSALGCRSLAGSADAADWAPEDDAVKRWNVLRRSPVAPAIGLALPRFLLRLPYGAETEPAEEFDFEEMPPARDHEAYLWGNPALACAASLGRTYVEAGWRRGTGNLLEVEDLPSHTFEESGEWTMQPCAEVWLTESAAEAVLQQGIMPLLSRRDRNSAQLLRFQSVAAPPRELWGPWS